MDNKEHIDCIMLAMSLRRALVKGVLGEFYPERVAVYVETVRNLMADEEINEVTSAFEILSAGDGQIDPVSCALISAAAIEIIEADIITDKKKEHVLKQVNVTAKKSLCHLS